MEDLRVTVARRKGDYIVKIVDFIKEHKAKSVNLAVLSSTPMADPCRSIDGIDLCEDGGFTVECSGEYDNAWYESEELSLETLMDIYECLVDDEDELALEDAFVGEEE